MKASGLKPAPVTRPVQVSKVAFAPNGQFTMALDASSYAWGWGSGVSGQLGNNMLLQSSPVSVLGGKQWLAIYPRNSSVMAIDASSYAWCWGNSSSGFLGDGSIIPASSPVSVLGGKRWLPQPIAGFGQFNAVLDASSYAWAWGSNGQGNLGDGSINNASSPVSVLGGKQWRYLATVASTVVVLDASSYAWTWGFNSSGSLGDGSTLNRSSPVSVLGAKQWKYLDAIASSVFGLDASSYAWGCGPGTSGQLGDGSTNNASSPVSVLGGKQWRYIRSSGDSFFAIDASSYAWAWGQNAFGQLGDGTVANKSSPVSVLGARQWLLIQTVPENTVVGLDSSSYAWAWGNNNFGIFGDGTTNNSSSPVSVLGNKQWLNLNPPITQNITAIDASSYVWAWGLGADGQLGQHNNLNNSSSPVSVRLIERIALQIFGK